MRRDRILTGRYNPVGGRRTRDPRPDRHRTGSHDRPTGRRRAGRRRRHHRHLPALPGAARPGFSARLLEAGDGVGGTWYWNRYPGARFDSESYTYGYLFSKELFDEWEWQEHFAAQPETERYLNHVVDRFDLRRHIRFGAAGHLGRVRRAVGHVDRRRPATARDDPGALPRSPRPACCRCRTSPTCRAATTSAASSTTPAAGRPSRSTSPASGSPSSAPSSSGVQVVPAIARRGRRRSPSTSAPPTGARR